MKKAYCLFFFLSLITCSHLSAQVYELNLDSGGLTLMNSNDSTILSGGVASVVGDGDVIQFGYYTDASMSDPFAGTWVPLTGDDGANSAFSTTSIGDDPDAVGLTNTNGTFAFPHSGNTSGDTYLTFTTGSSTTGNSLPNDGHIMAVRFYNGTTIGNSTYYGAASDASGAESWMWTATLTPSDIMNFSLADSGLSWLNNDVAYTGTPLLVTPEPEEVPLLAIGVAFLAYFHFRRRRTGALS